MSRKLFDTELKELTDSLIEMGTAVSNAIDNSVKALLSNDKELAKQVIEGDNVINEMEHSIEHQCLQLLLRQQPVARDLRKISAAIKMVTDIERIGDQAADISDIILSLNNGSTAIPLSIKDDLAKMSAAACDMVSMAVKSYVDSDLELAQETREKDDVIDRYFTDIRTSLASLIQSDSTDMDTIMDYLMIIKYLERIGDHAENICEWVEFFKTGIHKNERIL